MNSELEGGGGTPEATADDFIVDGSVQWRTLGGQLFASFWLRLGALVAGIIELVFGLLSSAVETAFSAYGSVFGLLFRGWPELFDAAWLTAGRSLAGGFGLAAWFVSVLVVAAFFLLISRALRTLIDGVTP